MASENLKRLWQDPEFRARMKARDDAFRELRKQRAWSRAGVPNGMRKDEADALWAKAHEQADRFIQIMKEQGELPDNEVVEVTDEHGDKTLVNVPSTDSGKAEAALREAFVLAVGPSTQNIKIQAINTVLNFTKSKPEAKTKLTVDPMAFLDEVAKTNDA